MNQSIKSFLAAGSLVFTVGATAENTILNQAKTNNSVTRALELVVNNPAPVVTQTTSTNAKVSLVP